MEILNSVEEIKNFIKDNRIAMLYFSSNSCSVCVDLLPKLQELPKQYPKVKFAKIEIDSIPAAAGTFSVFTLPCILMFIDEKETIRGARFISIMELKEKIERYYSLM
ncbi:thioredoxin family protein [Clostridium sp. OS1-26]|uniref:thioredoxin family protein n=1 Tax=Clostridium sp. OS1-26 TaxID=3070681 RepID=UPI0027E0435F|nr:thioredoxin family protein [Clostridium sp. OS1-26]WML37314.1 thioredoxin family protein [Clostridium sp. OS1-26]